MKTLQQELMQTRPWELPEETMVQLLRTHTLLTTPFEKLMREHGLTLTQYNVLRILRGAGPAGLGRNELRSRMIDRSPDVSRVVERMERAGLVERQRSSIDRRLIPIRLTPRGLRVVDSLDQPLREMQSGTVGQLREGDLMELCRLLTLLRQPLLRLEGLEPEDPQ
ncbi:MarR family winged helix-turn-helix transcriptional regulator [Deinococcus lacus]|uniref:MarR family winged helix-turn-helix transcriptional regulator n=1 Tax=Deinococcus lacus TaxID=392561 RepID=A0ABW1YEU2_9DEIO